MNNIAAENFKAISADGHVVHGNLRTVENPIGLALLVHGITADRSEWGFFTALSEEFAARGIASVAIDYRGHGLSELRGPEAISLSGVYLDIEAAWEEMKRIYSSANAKTIIVGNSFGGGLGYLFGQLNKVDKIIMTCPVTSYVADLNRVTQGWNEKSFSEVIPYASMSLSSNIIPEIYSFDRFIEYCPVDVDFHVFHGTEDSDVPFSESESFAKARGDRASIHPCYGMDHSFSAPEGTIDKKKKDAEYRSIAAEKIARSVWENI